MARRPTPAALALVLAALAPALAAAACPSGMPPAAGRALPREGLNQGLLTRAVLAEANAVRCARGLAPLRGAGALGRAGAVHSRRMARSGTLSHGGGADGLGGRLARAGAAYRRAAENVATLYRYPVDRGPVRIRDRARCRFSRGGRLLAPRSYAGLARDVVALWLDSRGHRQNLLGPRLHRAGAAAAFGPAPRYCGRYWVTLVLAG